MGVKVKTLLAYGTKYGATRECVKPLADMLDGEVEILDLTGVPEVQFQQYHKVVILSAVYAGDVPKYVKKFGKKYHDELMKLPFGICFCCMTEIEKQLLGYALNTFQRDLVEHSSIISCIGGKFQYDKMSAVDKQLLKLATKNQAYKKGQLIQLDGKTDFSTIEEYKMQAFANKMNSILVNEENV